MKVLYVLGLVMLLGLAIYGGIVYAYPNDQVAITHTPNYCECGNWTQGEDGWWYKTLRCSNDMKDTLPISCAENDNIIFLEISAEWATPTPAPTPSPTPISSWGLGTGAIVCPGYAGLWCDNKGCYDMNKGNVSITLKDYSCALMPTPTPMPSQCYTVYFKGYDWGKDSIEFDYTSCWKFHGVLLFQDFVHSSCLETLGYDSLSAPWGCKDMTYRIYYPKQVGFGEMFVGRETFFWIFNHFETSGMFFNSLECIEALIWNVELPEGYDSWSFTYDNCDTRYYWD